MEFVRTTSLLIAMFLFFACKNEKEVRFAATGVYLLANDEKEEMLTKILVKEYESLGLNDSLTVLPLHRCISATAYKVYIALAVNQSQEVLSNALQKKFPFILARERGENRKTEFFANIKEAYIYGYIYDKKHIQGTVAIFFVATDSALVRAFYDNTQFLTNKIKNE